MPTLGEVTALLDEWFPPHHADDWDAVGLVLGDPAVDVRRILLAVDPVAAVADEAVADDSDLLVCHHPLFLKGVHGIAATDPKGRLAHRLLTNGCALFTAHTNADSPGGRRLGVAGPGAGTAGRPAARGRPRTRAGQDRGVHPGRLGRAGASRPGGRRRRPDRRLRPGLVQHSGRGSVPPSRRRQPDDRRGRAGPRWSTRCASRPCARGTSPGRGRGVAGGAPLRGAGVRRDRAGRARGARPWLRPHRQAAQPDDPPRFRGTRRCRSSPRPLTGCASRATRSSTCSWSASAAAPATSCSTGHAGRGSTST